MGKKIAAVILILALLGAGGYYAKTEYDRWHAAQPEALLPDVMEDLQREIAEGTVTADLPDAERYGATCSVPVYLEDGTLAAYVDFEEASQNLLGKTLWQFADVRGMLSFSLVTDGEMPQAVESWAGAVPYTLSEDEAPLFPDRLASQSYQGIYSIGQFIAPDGCEVVKAQEDRLFLTIRGAEAEAPAIRAGLSRGLVLQRKEEGETVFALQMTEPLVLSEDKAVVFARCTSGEEEDATWTTDGCYLLEKDSSGKWSLTAEEPDQSSTLAYTDEEIYEIPQYVLPPEGRALAHPYYIMVNRQMNTVTVYTKDEEGKFTVPFKAMICSTGREGHETPAGNFAVMSFKAQWCYMVDGSYGQYATGFLEGGYLFHTICYTAKDKSTMMRDEYNMLGDFASAGCVRLQTADAKWIFDNCEVGTGVTVYDGPEAGPLSKPEKAVAEITDANDNGWDPTDPDPNNPWYRGN